MADAPANPNPGLISGLSSAAGRLAHQFLAACAAAGAEVNPFAAVPLILHTLSDDMTPVGVLNAVVDNLPSLIPDDAARAKAETVLALVRLFVELHPERPLSP